MSMSRPCSSAASSTSEPAGIASVHIAWIRTPDGLPFGVFQFRMSGCDLASEPGKAPQTPPEPTTFGFGVGLQILDELFG